MTDARRRRVANTAEHRGSPPALADEAARRRATEDLMLLLFRAKIVNESWRAERLPGVLPCFEGFLKPHPATSTTP